MQILKKIIVSCVDFLKAIWYVFYVAPKHKYDGLDELYVHESKSSENRTEQNRTEQNRNSLILLEC